MISLGGGLPHPSLFPFKALSVELNCGTVVDIPAEDLQGALQYSPTNGLVSFVDRLKAMVAQLGLSVAAVARALG